jgi:hypothetical protein
VVEGHRAEGGGSLHALLVRRGGMGKERTAVAIEALHRGTSDSFGVKKWKEGGPVGRWLARRGSARGAGTGEGRTWAAAAMGLAQKNSNLFDLFKEI